MKLNPPVVADDLSTFLPNKTKQTMRILILHGFAQNSEVMAIRTRKICAAIEDQLAQQGSPVQVDPMYLDGPLQFLDESSPIEVRAWWKTLDDTSHYDELQTALEYVAEHLQRQPVDGVIGFSQGATLAVMLAALCEGSPERMKALACQGSPIQMAAPQRPMQFVVACSGWRGTPRWYSGFYKPKLFTPSLQVVARLDHLISGEDSRRLVAKCRKAEVLMHNGGHWVPTSPKMVKAIADFVCRTWVPLR